MQFNTLLFILFFLPLFVLSMFFIKNNNIRNTLLLLFSLLFYLLNDQKYFILLLIVIIISFMFARKVKDNKVAYILYLIITIGLLVFFKYGSYLLKSIKDMNILMPLGISYFLFMSISYVSDCYYNKYNYSNNIIEVASYISFFPCISCGPINRFNQFSVYYKNKKNITYSSISNGLVKFIFGLSKKIIIADQLGVAASIIFDKTTALSTPLAWFGVIVAGFQMYYDFSGYSDMAIGIGEMIGFKINKNFDYPFISKSWSELWRRWHISLGSWFKDYVYIPLGGNRVSKARFIINILIVWILTGIWHGSSLNFILWGFLIGVIVLIEKLLNIKYNKVVGILIVNVLFFSSIVIFKNDSINSILLFYKNMFTWTGFNFSYYKLLGILYLWPIVILAILFVIPKTLSILKKNDIIFNIFIIICLILSFVYMVGGTQQTFVYFAF